MLDWWKKKEKPSIESVAEQVAKAVAVALAAQREEDARVKAEQESAARQAMADAAAVVPDPVEEELPPMEPLLRVTITCKTNEKGNLEAVYDVESNDAGIQSVDRAYDGPRWNKMRSDQEKIILFLYDAVSTLAEPLLPDATVTELDLRREAFEVAPPNEPFVTNEVDISGATRYGS